MPLKVLQLAVSVSGMLVVSGLTTMIISLVSFTNVLFVSPLLFLLLGALLLYIDCSARLLLLIYEAAAPTLRLSRD